MASSEKPHPVYQGFVDWLRRQSAREYICPLCSSHAWFPHEPKLWDHAKQSHMDYLESNLKGDEGQKRRQFSEDAILKVKPPRQKILREPRVTGSKASSNDSMQQNFGEDMKLMSRSDRPGSAPGIAIQPEKDIRGLEKLSLSQTQSRLTPSPSSNPRKRASVKDEALSDAELKKRDETIRSQRTKALSGRPSPNFDPEHGRRATLGKDPNFDRSKAGLNRRLSDPSRGSSFGSTTSHSQAIGDNGNARGLDSPPRHHIFPSANVKRSWGKEDSSPSPQKPMQIGKSAPEKSQPAQSSNPFQASPTRPPPAEVLLQPETRPISHAQLAAEVKGIYAGLVMVEAKCVDVDEKQSIAAQEKHPKRQTKLNNEQWQALTALHRALLHEHHDFFLASQHPSAGPALTRLAAQYSMPRRMWRHAIHSFLEVLRHRLPESLDHMLTFIYIAYSMMVLLYETVTAFEDTWIEYLGDFARYRMAIEDVDRHDHEVWSGAAHFWYSKAADKNPHIERLYHHLAILARPGSFEQLSLYTRSLTCVQSFTTAQSSIMTVFKPALQGEKDVPWRELTSFLNTLAKAIEITSTVEDEEFPWPAEKAGRPLPEDFVIRGQVWSRGHFPEKWFEDTRVDDDERSMEVPSMAAPRIKRTSWLGVRLASLSQWTHHDRWSKPFPTTKYLGRYRMATEDDKPGGGPTSWAYRRLKASSSLSNGAIRAFVLALSLRQASASSSGNNLSPALKTSSEWPFGPRVPSFSSWPFAVFGVLLAVTSHLLARRLGPLRVSATMMAVFGFVWLRISNDKTTTPMVLWTTFSLGVFFMWSYASSQIGKYNMTQGYAVIALLLGIIFDCGAAGLSSSHNTGVFLDDLIRFSLLMFSLGLFLATYAASQAHRHHRVEPGDTV